MFGNASVMLIDVLLSNATSYCQSSLTPSRCPRSPRRLPLTFRHLPSTGWNSTLTAYNSSIVSNATSLYNLLGLAPVNATRNATAALW